MTLRALFISSFDGASRMKTLKQILSVVCTITLFFYLFSLADHILMRKDSKIKYQQFVEDTQVYDVLFLGSSHVHNGISPLDLFKNYGITSYNFASPGLFISNAYFQLEEIAELYPEKLPKTIVLDIFTRGNPILAEVHKAWDFFPLSKSKWNVSRTLYKDNWIELLLPFSVYHSRWIEAFKDIDKAVNTRFGAEAQYKVGVPDKEIITDRKDKSDFDTFEMQYLEKIREFCKTREIRLILIQIPYTYRTHKQREANAIYDYANKHGILYVNYINETTPINYLIDSANSGHLNFTGCKIITNEIGKLLQQNPKLHDRRNEPIAERWNKAYQDYINYRINRLKGLKNTKEFLMACNDSDLIVKIEINEKILSDKIKRLLIERLEKIDGNAIKRSTDKVTHTKADKKTQKCDISVVVFRRDNKKEVFRAAFSASEKMK